MNRRGRRTFLLMAQCASVLAVLIGCPAPAQEAPQTLARELLREMIETDTTGEHGDTTPLANALAARFRQAGFPAEDVQVLGPQTRHRNLVVRLRGSGRARPILVISHLDVVEAKPEDWTVPPFKLTEKTAGFMAVAPRTSRARPRQRRQHSFSSNRRASSPSETSSWP